MRESHSATITTVTPSSIASKSQSGQRSTTVGSIYTMHNTFRNHSNTNPSHALLPSIHTWGIPLAMFSAFPISSGVPMPTLPWRFISYWRRRPYGWHTSAARPLPFYFFKYGHSPERHWRDCIWSFCEPPSLSTTCRPELGSNSSIEKGSTARTLRRWCQPRQLASFFLYIFTSTFGSIGSPLFPKQCDWLLRYDLSGSHRKWCHHEAYYSRKRPYICNRFGQVRHVGEKKCPLRRAHGQ